MSDRQQSSDGTPPAFFPRAVLRPDRRVAPRDTPGAEPSRARLITLVEGTFREMPGLELTLRQAVRFFALRDRTCRAVLDAMVEHGQLQLSADGQYRRR